MRNLKFRTLVEDSAGKTHHRFCFPKGEAIQTAKNDKWANDTGFSAAGNKH
jgi:hypothetical protein